MHHSEHSWVLWAYDKGGKGGIESKATLQRTVYGLDLPTYLPTYLSLLPMNKYLLPAAGRFDWICLDRTNWWNGSFCYFPITALLTK